MAPTVPRCQRGWRRNAPIPRRFVRIGIGTLGADGFACAVRCSPRLYSVSSSRRSARLAAKSRSFRRVNVHQLPFVTFRLRAAATAMFTAPIRRPGTSGCPRRILRTHFNASARRIGHGYVSTPTTEGRASFQSALPRPSKVLPASGRTAGTFPATPSAWCSDPTPPSTPASSTAKPAPATFRAPSGGALPWTCSALAERDEVKTSSEVPRT